MSSVGVMPVQLAAEGGTTAIFSESTELKILIGLGLALVVLATVITIGLLMGDQTRWGRWARGGNKRAWRSPSPELLRWMGLGRFRGL